jgi:hypothetical protein
MTLRPTTVHHVRRLLAQGLSLREVTRRMKGVTCYGTICQIAHGDYHPHQTADPDDPDDDSPPAVEKCNGCNYIVEMPCRICRARALRKAMLEQQRAHRNRHHLPPLDQHGE